MGKRRIMGGSFTSFKINNHRLSMGAAEEANYHIIPDGIDSASSPYDIYFNFERPANGMVIRATAAGSITEFNGDILKSPLTINSGANDFKDVQIESFKLVTTASNVIEVTIK